MNYFEFSPCSRLAPYIKTYWFLEGNIPAGAIQAERIFPDGCMELIIHYGEAFKKVTGEHTEQQASSFVFGQLEEYLEVLPSATTGVMGIKFYPNGLFYFTGVPINEFTQQAVELQQLFKTESHNLPAIIASSPSPEQKVQVIENFLLQSLDASKPKDGLTHYIIKDIYRANGCLPVSTLIKQYHLSERQIERRFAQEVGLSLKTFSRIIRFQRVFQLAAKATSLTDLALDGGYFDQAHFAREFKSFTGFSPRQYFTNQPGLSSYFLAD